MTDVWESANGLDPNDNTDAMSDYDNDGLTAIDEMIFGSSALLADTDGDGIFDGAEILRGSDLLDVLSVPQQVATVGDYDGDGLSDYVVFDATNQTITIETTTEINTIVLPEFDGQKMLLVNGEFDGDGQVDLTFHSPDTRRFLTLYDGSTATITTLGEHSVLESAIADYDGDGISDYAVYDPLGEQWLVIKSSTGELSIKVVSPGTEP